VSFDIQLQHVDGEVLLRVAGDLNLNEAATFRQALIDGLQPGTGMQLDLSQVSAIDLSAMQLLCSAHHTGRKRDAAVRVVNMPERLWETARAAGFDGAMVHCPHRKDNARCLWMKE
jgi:anti-anti-sigma factor